MQAATIPVDRNFDVPARIGLVDLARALGEDFLNVAVAQLGIGVADQSDHAADHGVPAKVLLNPEVKSPLV